MVYSFAPTRFFKNTALQDWKAGVGKCVMHIIFCNEEKGKSTLLLVAVVRFYYNKWPIANDSTIRATRYRFFYVCTTEKLAFFLVTTIRSLSLVAKGCINGLFFLKLGIRLDNICAEKAVRIDDFYTAVRKTGKKCTTLNASSRFSIGMY